MDHTHNDFVEIVDNFIPLLQVSHQAIIDSVVGQLADNWTLMPNLAQQIQDYLHCEPRIAKVKEAIMATNYYF